MARIPTPWFWEERAEWCVNLNGQRRKLGPHPEGYPPPKKAKGKWNAPQPIVQAFHALMAEKPEIKSIPAAGGLTIAEVYDKFLAWCKQHREALTYKGYHEFIQGLIDHLGDIRLNAVQRAVRGLPVKVSMVQRTDDGTNRTYNALVTEPVGGKPTVEGLTEE